MTARIDYKILASALQMSESEVRSLVEKSAKPDVKSTPVESPKPFLQERKITLYHSDFLTAAFLPDESVDLTVTSPPYNVGIDYSAHDDAHEYEQYLRFSEQWLKQVYRVTRPDGRLCMKIFLWTKTKVANKAFVPI